MKVKFLFQKMLELFGIHSLDNDGIGDACDNAPALYRAYEGSC